MKTTQLLTILIVSCCIVRITAQKATKGVELTAPGTIIQLISTSVNYLLKSVNKTGFLAKGSFQNMVGAAKSMALKGSTVETGINTAASMALVLVNVLPTTSDRNVNNIMLSIKNILEFFRGKICLVDFIDIFLPNLFSLLGNLADTIKIITSFLNL